MQLDSQSVEKVPQYVRMSFCPENVGNWSSSPQNESERPPRSIQSCFPSLQGPSWSRSPSGLFRSNRVKYDYNRPSDRKKKKTCFSIRSGIVTVFDPVGSRKCCRWFPATEPLEKRKTALDRSWRNLRLILMRGRPISNILGAAHANVLKGAFSTDCKCNCIRIGLTELWDREKTKYNRKLVKVRMQIKCQGI